MNNWIAPSDAELDQVAALATRLENRTYFFERLENPEWVSALARRGAFADPPDPVPADEPGYVQLPPWPEGRYLARMAPQAPDAVAAALEELPSSANPGVTRILLEAVTALPDEQFRRLAPKTVEWITSTETTVFTGHFAEAAADAITRLARAGKVKQALTAAGALLWIERLSDASDGSPSDQIFTRTPEPVGRLSHWTYKRAVERILPDLVDSAGLESLKLLLEMLSVAVKLSRRDDEPPNSDCHSYIWRPAIEDHPQNSDRGVRCLLVTAARDAAVRLARVSDVNLRAVVQLLEAGTLVHRRIALHVLAVVPDGAEMVAERIASRDFFDEPRLKHEYAELLRSRLGEAPPDVRRTFLGWVLAGPDLESFRQRYSAASPEDEVAYAECWKRDWLSIVADHLSGDEAKHYRELVTKHGEAKHPDFLSWTESWSGPETPLTPEDMQSMPAGEVVEFLASWQPGDDTGPRFEPSMEGLGRTFQAVVADRADDFAAVATRMQALDPTYVRSFLSGLEAAVRAGASFQWYQPILLMASVLEHPFVEREEDAPGFERDPGWSWTRGQAASLLQEGVADRNNRISFELREEVWGVLEPLTRDPNPSPAYEAAEAGYSSMDPLTLSINTNRGKAMHATIAYALWCRRGLDARGIDTAAGFDLIPEVRTVLDEHLDPNTEPSLAVRAVYGNWLPWLILLDEGWAAANTAQILPSDPELADFRDAAWSTYVRWCQPYDPVYDMLQHEYEAAVERIPSEGADDAAGDERADAKLGEHLVTFYWRGRLQPSLLERWFELADDKLAARVMGFLGRSLNNSEGDIDAEVLQRIRQLWDSRLEAIASDPEAHQSEADAFASTFVSARLDDDWSLAGLEVTLLGRGSRWSGHPVMARLAEIAAIKPAEATRCALQMLERTADDWDHLGWRDEVRDILAATDHATDPETLKHRKAIVDHYVKRGEHDFRDFVPSQP